MSDIEPRLDRANSLPSLRIDSLMTPIKALIRSNTVAGFMFPHITLPNRYKVFSRLRDKWDPAEKNKKIKSRLHLAKFTGILNLRRLELKQVPDEIFYLEMDEKEEKKIKQQEIMTLKGHTTKKSQCEMETAARAISGTLLNITSHAEVIPKESDNYQLPESIKQMDYKEFQFFLDNYSPEPMQSCGDIVGAYIDHRLHNLTQWLLKKRIPLKKIPLGTHTDSNEAGLKVKKTVVLGSKTSGTGSPQEKIAPIGETCLKIMQEESPTSALKIEISMKESKKLTSPTTTGSVQSTGVIRKTLTQSLQPRIETTKTPPRKLADPSFKCEGGKQAEFDYRMLPTVTRSAQLTTDSVTKIPVKVFSHQKVLGKPLSHLQTTMQKQLSESRSEETNKRSPSVTTSVSRNASQVLSGVSKLSKIPIQGSVSTGKVDKVPVHKPNVGERSSSTKFLSSRKAVRQGNKKATKLTGIKSSADDKTTSKELTFFRGRSLFGVNPYTGEEMCFLQDVHDIKEIKSKIKLFLYTFYSMSHGNKEDPSYLAQKIMEETFIKPHTTSSIQSSPKVPTSHSKTFLKLQTKRKYLTPTANKELKSSSTSVLAQSCSTKIPRTETFIIESDSRVLSPDRSDSEHRRSPIFDQEQLISLTESFDDSNSPLTYRDFEKAPEKYCYFRGKSLMCENPLTGEEFCIFHNINSSVEIKNKVTELLLSCRPEKDNMNIQQLDHIEMVTRMDSVPTVPAKITKNPSASESLSKISKIPKSSRTVCKSSTNVKSYLSHHSKIMERKLSTDSTNIVARELTPELTFDEIWTETNVSNKATYMLPAGLSKHKEASFTTQAPTRKKEVTFTLEKPLSKHKETPFTLPKPVGQLKDAKFTLPTEMGTDTTDTVSEKCDIEDVLTRKMSDMEINIKPLVTSNPKSVKSLKGTALLCQDSQLSLLGRVKTTPMTLGQVGTRTPKSTTSRSVQKLSLSPSSQVVKSSTLILSRQPTSQYAVTRQMKKSTDKSQKLQSFKVHSNSDRECKKKDKNSDEALKIGMQRSGWQKQGNIKEISRKQRSERLSNMQKKSLVGVKREIPVTKNPEELQLTPHSKQKIHERRKIEIIILAFNHLTDISWKIQYLKRLKAIHLENNLLTVIPNEVKELQQLEELSVDNNKIICLPVALYNLSLLRFLSLKGNRLLHISSLLQNLENLEHLDLSHNYIRYLPEGIQHLVKLKKCILSRNEIISVPERFPPNVEELYINNNEIKILPDLTHLAKLRILSVKANKLSTLPKISSSIYKVYASQNVISELDSSLIQNWSQIVTFDLCHNRLLRLPDNVNMMSSLKKFLLSHNEIHSLPRSLGSIFCLTQLDVSMNPISGVPYHLLKGHDMYQLLKYIRCGARKFQVEYTEDKIDIGIHIDETDVELFRNLKQDVYSSEEDVESET